MSLALGSRIAIHPLKFLLQTNGRRFQKPKTHLTPKSPNSSQVVHPILPVCQPSRKDEKASDAHRTRAAPFSGPKTSTIPGPVGGGPSKRAIAAGLSRLRLETRKESNVAPGLILVPRTMSRFLGFTPRTVSVPGCMSSCFCRKKNIRAKQIGQKQTGQTSQGKHQQCLF